MKILTVVGARPQFIKAAPVSKELAASGHVEVLVHTGQHYDRLMSNVFFEQLSIPEPAHFLGIGSATHGRQTGRMLMALEDVLLTERPVCVLVYGDTNSTLAAALAAVKLLIPVAHVEAGERNFTQTRDLVHPSTIPEETNRVVTDHLSTLLFCATSRAVDNLRREGISDGVYQVGDVSLDALLCLSDVADERSTIVDDLLLPRGSYVLTTVHRAINTTRRERLQAIVTALLSIPLPIVFPMHPRTRTALQAYELLDQLAQSRAIQVIEPVGYLDMLALERDAHAIVTDSGGVIREAYFLGVPSIIVDDTTEWIDLVTHGWARLVGARTELIEQAVAEAARPSGREQLFGDGSAAKRIVRHIEDWRENDKRE